MERTMSKDGDGAEEVLSSGEQELRLLVETIPALVWRAGPEGNVEYVNKRVLNYFGAPLGDIVGWGWAERVHPEDVAFKVRSWLENLETENPHDVVCRFRGADGRYRWFNVRGEPLRASDGTVLRWYGVLIDIDDRTKALRESEYKLRQIFETVPGQLWSADPAGEPTQLNQRLLDYSGMRFEEFKHRGWEAFLHPDDFPEIAKAFYHAIQTGTSYQAVNRLRRADGEFRWHHTRGEPLRDWQGRIVQWYGLNVDIDEGKRAEDQLRRSEAHLAEAQRLSHSGSAIYNDTTILYWSDETYRIFGLDPRKDVPSREAALQAIHPDDRERVRAEIERAVRQKRDYKLEYRIALPAGTIKYIEVTAHPKFSASGELIEVVSTLLDVTERQRAEEALRESEFRLRQIFETVPGLLWSLDPAGEPTQLNQRMLDYSGMRFEDFEHGGWRAFLHPDDFPETAKAFYHAIQTGTSYQGVYRLRRADGEFRWHQARCEPLRDRQGRIIQWYGLNVDIDEGKRAEDLLRRSEAYLAEAQRLSHTGSAAYNDSTVFYWSDETYRIFGLDPRNGLPSPEAVQQLIHPEDRERAREEARQAVRQKRDYKAELRIVLPAGTIKHIEVNAHPKFSSSGDLVEIVSTLVDVTERKRAEEALRESEYKLRQILETVPSLTWSTGQPGFIAQVQAILNVLPAYTWYAAPSGGITFVNKRTADYLGLPKDHPLRFGIDVGAQWDAHIQLLHPDDQEGSREAWSTSLRTGEAGEFSFRVGNAQGDYRWFLTRGEPLRASDGTLLLWVGVNLDIEELKCAEEALRESEAKFRDYAESASDWFWEIGPDYKFTLLTGNAFGSDSADRIGTAYWDQALDLETEPEKWRLIQATLDARKPFRDFVYCSARRDGSPMYVKASGKPVFDADGEFRGYRGTGTDVTALMCAQEEHERLRQLEADLAHTNRLSVMGELTASLAHEITQPIAAARNNARAAMHFLDRNPPDLGEIREALACVVDDADRAGDIIDRIRDHIKKAPPRKSRFDLNKAIDEVIGLARSAITTNGVSVQTCLTEGLFPIEGDRVQLQQVVLNLILNAVEAMSTVEVGPRELLISTEQTRSGGVLVSVRDSGPGIDPDHLDRVFQAFYTTKSSGVGMGLSICRSIIDAHGGRLWADTNASRGAVLRFSLPGAGKELTNSRRSAHLTGEPHQDTVSDAAHQTAYEGNKRPHRS
jgi:PAS domain S-box-containing protein